ncbi:MAG: hypothetical protein M1834_000970 [Cirrosporium novae-zelandiae]|nr:MAG: hypothetical protein M1834_000970 [Cirrosporium novae-zelandiae]
MAVTDTGSISNTRMLTEADPGSFGNHVTPFAAWKGTKGEWITDPLGSLGQFPTVPG